MGIYNQENIFEQCGNYFFEGIAITPDTLITHTASQLHLRWREQRSTEAHIFSAVLQQLTTLHNPASESNIMKVIPCKLCNFSTSEDDYIGPSPAVEGPAGDRMS